MDPSATGPSIGPSAGPGVAASLPPPPPSLPANPHQHSASGSDFGSASVAVAAQPASLGMPMYGGMPPQAGGQPPVMLPPLHYSGVDPSQPFTYQPSGGPGQPPMGAMGMHPSRLANLAGGGPMGPPQPPQPQAGMVRSADQMMMDGNGTPGEDGVPPAKRQRVQRLPGGQYYPEETWTEWHKVCYNRRLKKYIF